MTQFKSILVATDFSPAATQAVRRAALLAQQHGAHLRLLHVVSAAGSAPLRRLFATPIDLELKTLQTRASLRRFSKEIVGRHGVAVTFDVVVGDAFEAIHRACERADLVVLGQHGAPSLKERMIGGTSERLVRTCRKPVLVVKRAAEDRPYRHVLVPVDFTASSEGALGLAGTLAVGATIHAFHAHAAIQAVREREDAEMADLIVVGRQAGLAMADFLLGGVTRRLLSHSKCDVLIIPRAVAEAWRARAPRRASSPPRLLWK